MSRSRRVVALVALAATTAFVANRLTADPGGSYDPATGAVTGGAR